MTLPLPAPHHQLPVETVDQEINWISHINALPQPTSGILPRTTPFLTAHLRSVIYMREVWKNTLLCRRMQHLLPSSPSRTKQPAWLSQKQKQKRPKYYFRPPPLRIGYSVHQLQNTLDLHTQAILISPKLTISIILSLSPFWSKSWNLSPASQICSDAIPQMQDSVQDVSHLGLKIILMAVHCTCCFIGLVFLCVQ